MLQSLRNRLQKDEEGFTLIELMVVVLIIAILLAIAIPTFLGARERAQDRAAQSNLRNAFTAEKVFYTDNQAYTSGTAGIAAVKAIEPSLTFAVDGSVTTAGTVYVATSNSGGTTDDTVIVGTKSASGKCFYLKDTAGGSTAGTTYGTTDSSGCGAPSAATVAAAKW